MPQAVKPIKTRKPNRITTHHPEVFDLVDQYLRLYESEGWPPASWMDNSPSHQAARQRLLELRHLSFEIQAFLSHGEKGQRDILVQFKTKDPLDVCDALRLGVCENRLSASMMYRAVT